jgi:hypothetical protein
VIQFVVYNWSNGAWSGSKAEDGSITPLLPLFFIFLVHHKAFESKDRLERESFDLMQSCTVCFVINHCTIPSGEFHCFLGERAAF